MKASIHRIAVPSKWILSQLRQVTELDQAT